jgi:hypothetical protein
MADVTALRHHHEGHFWKFLANALHEFHAIHAGQLEVAEHGVISPLPEHVQGEVAIWTNRSGQPAVS